MQVYMGGIVHTSLANWKKSSCLAIFLAGCDFNCPYCNTPHLHDFKEEFLQDVLEVKRQINSYSDNIETVYFTGGEPGLQRQPLLNLARHSKQIGHDVGIATNGSRPSTLLSLLREGILDFVEMDLKCPADPGVFERVTRSKTFFKQTDEIANSVKETIALLSKYDDKVGVFFKTTIVKNLNDDFEMIRQAGELIKHINCTWILQAFCKQDTKENNVLNFDEVRTEELEFLKEKLKGVFPQMIIEIQ